MGSQRASWFRRNILYRVPFLFKEGDCTNYHWRWDKICYCWGDGWPRVL
jgi:hypothetical protein